MRIVHVAGARPNFMKIAPIMREMSKYPDEFDQLLVHTGQHYDRTMSESFFDDLELPKPDINLGVGSGSHAQQTARIMLAFEPVVLEHRPDWIIVVGDVNSTLAGSLVASKIGVRIAHVEAGLRSFDRSMPEEINRVLTDQIADLLLTTERSAEKNLLREGVAKEKIHFVGNVMIDTMLKYREQALSLNVLEIYGLKPQGFALLTLHRPSNVDVPESLGGILDALAEIQTRLPIIFPAHPRTMKKIREFRLGRRLAAMKNLKVTQPLGYLKFLNIMANARLVLTDSGGIQEETTILGVPCLTLRENTERPVTVTEGTNIVVLTNPRRIVRECLAILENRSKQGRSPQLWDGKAAQRIVDVIIKATK